MGVTLATTDLVALDVEDGVNLDANATAAPTPGVIAAVTAALAIGGNPSSAHAAGDAGRRLLESARDAVAALCPGVFPEDVVFTSGCTEANNQIVACARAAGAVLVTTAVEHPSLLRAAEAYAAEGGEVHVLPVDAEGRLRLDRLIEQLDALQGPILVSVQWVNSETGVLQDIPSVAKIVRTRPASLFHSDAAQAFGRCDVAVGENAPDIITVSGHKLHAPMGVGAVMLREGESRLRPLLLGGAQEGGRRAGTPAVALIAGFAEACRARKSALASDMDHMRALRDRLEAGVIAALPSARINGAGSPRVANTSNICFPGVDATALVARLDAEGVFVSQGSACQSRHPRPSPVLEAMGLSAEDAFSSVRFSVSALNRLEEIDAALPIIIAACHSLGIHS